MRTIYLCEYCDSSNSSKEWMENHERECIANPVNRSCLTCDLLGESKGRWYCKGDDTKILSLKKIGNSCYKNKELRLKKFKKIVED